MLTSMGFWMDVAGWTGAASFLVAYWLASNGRLQARSRLFQVLNLLGALCVGGNSAYHGAFPSVGLNAVWALIGVHTLLSMRAALRRVDGGGEPDS